MRYTPRQYATRLFWMVVNPLRHAYWYVVRPHTLGAKCLVEHDGAVLLVRINYAHKRWTVPGGGVNRGETPEHAAIRELQEEVGVSASKVTKLGEYVSTHQYKVDTVHVYRCTAQSRGFKVDGFEISEAGWFRPEELPAERQPSVDKILAMRTKQLA